MSQFLLQTKKKRSLPTSSASKRIIFSLLEREDFILAAQSMTKYWIIPNTSKILSITKKAANVYDPLCKAQHEDSVKCFVYKTKKREAFSFQAHDSGGIIHLKMYHGICHLTEK